MPKGTPNLQRWRERPGLQPGRPLTEKQAARLRGQIDAWIERVVQDTKRIERLAATGRRRAARAHGVDRSSHSTKSQETP